MDSHELAAALLKKAPMPIVTQVDDCLWMLEATKFEIKPLSYKDKEGNIQTGQNVIRLLATGRTSPKKIKTK